MTASWIARQHSRRQFILGGLAAGAGALATASPLARLSALAAAPNPSNPLKVVIVGAGLAGLCAAYELEQRGHQVVILEANPRRIGGRVFTHRFGDGLYGEFGAMRIPAVHQLTRHYVARFGLTLRPFVQSNPNAYYVRGHRFRISQEHQVNDRYALTASEASKSPLDLWLTSVGGILERFLHLGPAGAADGCARPCPTGAGSTAPSGAGTPAAGSSGNGAQDGELVVGHRPLRPRGLLLVLARPARDAPPPLGHAGRATALCRRAHLVDALLEQGALESGVRAVEQMLVAAAAATPAP